MGLLRKASLTKPAEEAGKSWPGIVIGFFVAFGGILFGYVLPFIVSLRISDHTY